MNDMAFESRLAKALQRRDVKISPQVLLSALQEAAGVSTEPLSQGEMDFLLAHSDLDESAFSVENRIIASMKLYSGQAEAQELLEKNSYSTAETARLLGRDSANIRRSRLNGSLYSPSPSIPGQNLLFPAWQFFEGKPLPGLKQVIKAFPKHLHPLSIERFMTAEHEFLQGMSPSAWLAGGGPVQPVLSLVEELGRE